MDNDLDEVTAYHEAGHAVMSVLMGGRVLRVTIEPPDDDGVARYGETMTQWPPMATADVWQAEICVSLAGPVAEMLYTSDSVAISEMPEWAMDWQNALATAKAWKRNSVAAQKLLKQSQDRIEHLFGQDHAWAAVSAVADELLAHQTLEAEQVDQVVSFWLG